MRTNGCPRTSAPRPSAGSAARALGLVAAVALAGGLTAACRQDMHEGPRYDPLAASDVLPGGASAQPLVDGTVARGHLDADTLLYTGKENGQDATVFPFPITRADLDRGEERFNIYCSPCHGRTGEGNGMVVQRGYRQAASYHNDRLRQAPVGHFFDVITNGFGAMPDYSAQIAVADRWRIIAYIRVLQLTHNAKTSDVPPDELQKLMNPSTTAAPAPTAGEAGGH